MRTCIGCRTRSSTANLIRVVIDPSVAIRSTDEGATSVQSVIVDTRRVLPGRGAWLHAKSECLEQAERRRAFRRALRTNSVVVEAVHAFIAENGGNTVTTSGQ